MRTINRRHVNLLLGLACFPSIPGCGLLYIPKIDSFPEPIREIRACDFDNGHQLDSAQLEFDVVKTNNWTHFPPYICRPKEARLRSEYAGRLEVVRIADGAFVVTKRDFLGLIHCFFPIPLPLGWALYHDHLGQITIRADGYQPMCFEYAPSTMRCGKFDRWPEIGVCELDSRGILTFGMRKADASLEPRGDGPPVEKEAQIPDSDQKNQPE